MLWLWITISCLIIIIFILLLKLYLLQKSAREIEAAFNEKFITDSNTLIDISSKDKYMRHLASSINTQLRTLRKERHYFQQGNLELKNAVTNISHDLRTPLTAICGYLNLLEQTENSETAEQYIAVIKERTSLLTQLTEELFQYSVILSTKEHLVCEPVVINPILEESIAAFYTVLKQRGIVPQIQLTETKIIRDLDRSALTRIFSNLLSNVIKYSDGDLKITLSENGEIIFSNMASGLDEIQVGKLFERFYTVETACKSTGLGLSISKMLVEEMGGSILADFEKNRLTIRIRF